MFAYFFIPFSYREKGLTFSEAVKTVRLTYNGHIRTNCNKSLLLFNMNNHYFDVEFDNWINFFLWNE